jgi:hypothetical protein
MLITGREQERVDKHLRQTTYAALRNSSLHEQILDFLSHQGSKIKCSFQLRDSEAFYKPGIMLMDIATLQGHRIRKKIPFHIALKNVFMTTIHTHGQCFCSYKHK